MSRWRVTMTGTQPTSGNTVRDAVETDAVEADGAGAAVAEVLAHGWWDSFDQGEAVTLTVEPILDA
jgi:hypothetical protein